MIQKTNTKKDENCLQHSVDSQGRSDVRKDSAEGKFSSHEKAVSNPVPGKNEGRNK